MCQKQTTPINKITSKKQSVRQEIEDFLTPVLFNLTEFNHKKVEVRFNVEQISTEGGLLLLKEVDKLCFVAIVIFILKNLWIGLKGNPTLNLLQA
jgi:hypothetical protein